MEHFRLYLYIFLISIIFTFYASVVAEDKPCAQRNITGRSPLCLCNETYCDTITRHLPASGQYVAYTSSEGGLRFDKTSGWLRDQGMSCQKCVTLHLDPCTVYQTIEGFGGAVTDAVGIHWQNMSDALQQQLIKSYFSDEGLEYNMMRVPIGGSDFSTRAYAYNELPVNDINLTNFSLAYEDYEYKLPFIRAAMRTASTPIQIVATTWSPPGWMKTNNNLTAGYLKPEYYQTYADYHYKFIEQYEGEGVPIWAITTTNEPMDGILHLANFNCLGWTASSMGYWIVNNLGPTIRNSRYKDVKILACDDQRISIPYWFNVLVREHPKALEYVDGLAVHYYTDSFAPAGILNAAIKAYPSKFILATEACEGSLPWQEKVKLGSWNRARTYISDIITDLTHNVVGWIDWNLCLDLQGGPNWVENYVDAAIIVFPAKGIFAKQPMYYAQGHFSKFIPRGSRRIKVTETLSILSLFSAHIEHVAFLTPNNTVVVVLHNTGISAAVSIKLKGKQLDVNMPQRSITTIEIAYVNNDACFTDDAIDVAFDVV